MRVVALKAFSTGTLTMGEKQVKEIPDELAAELIEQGIVAKSPEYYGGSGGGGVLVVHDNDGTLEKTWKEIKDADFAVVKISNENGYESGCVTNVGKINTNYDVQAFEWGQDQQTLEPVASVKTYRASSADGYPVYVNE